MKTSRQINNSIKKQLISEGFNDYLSIDNKVIENNELEQENKIVLTFESTCQIGVILTYEVFATYEKGLDKIYLRYTGQPV